MSETCQYLIHNSNKYHPKFVTSYS